jgi:hypothetical protein
VLQLRNHLKADQSRCELWNRKRKCLQRPITIDRKKVSAKIVTEPPGWRDSRSPPRINPAAALIKRRSEMPADNARTDRPPLQLVALPENRFLARSNHISEVGSCQLRESSSTRLLIKEVDKGHPFPGIWRSHFKTKNDKECAYQLQPATLCGSITSILRPLCVLVGEALAKSA